MPERNSDADVGAVNENDTWAGAVVSQGIDAVDYSDESHTMELVPYSDKAVNYYFSAVEKITKPSLQTKRKKKGDSGGLSSSADASGKPPMNGYWYKGYFFEWSPVHDRVDWPGYTEELVNQLGEPQVLGADFGNDNWSSLTGATQSANKLTALSRWIKKENPKEGTVYTKDSRYVYYVSWLFPDNLRQQIGRKSAYENAAAGNYNEKYKKLAQRIKDAGIADKTIIRLHPEHNGDWQGYAGDGNEELFKEAFRQFVESFRTVDKNIMFGYSPAIHQSKQVALDAYPGDEYVDYLLLSGPHDGTSPLYQEENFDVCDNSREYPDVSKECGDAMWEEAWEYYKNNEFGLNDAAEFADQHNLPMAFVEWGLKNKKDSYASEFMGGDNERFVRAMYQWMVEHNVHFQTEFESIDKPWHLISGNVPNSLQAYKETFKGGSDTDWIGNYISGGSANNETDKGLTSPHSHDIPDEGPVTIHGITFQNVVNAVDDLGMDPAGNQPVDQAFREVATGDTLIVFPPGNYLWEEEHDVEDVSNFGMMSSTGDPEDVTFEFPKGFTETLAIRDGSVNVLVEGFEIAQTSDRDTGVGIVVRADDKAEIHHINFTGFSPSYEPSNQLYATIETTEGVGNISNIKIDGGGVEDTYPNRMVGIYGGTPHRGELIIRNCDVRELGSSGIRYTGDSGAVKVENCYFENIDNGALRIFGNGHESKKSWVKGCEFVVDKSLVSHLPDGETYENSDMIRLDSSHDIFSGLLIEDCVFDYREHPDGSFARGCIAKPGYTNHGEFTVRNCEMVMDEDGLEAIHISGGEGQTYGKAATIENIAVTGSSSGDKPIVLIENRDDSQITDSCIDMPDRPTGVKFENSDGCTVEDSGIAVSGEQVVSQNSNVETSGLSSTADCRKPGDSSPQKKLAHSHDIPDEGPVTIHGITFQNVVNAKEDLGMDSSGGSPNDSEFENVWDDESTLIKFPPGEYRFDERHDSNSLKDFGIIGTGSNREDTVIRTKDGDTQRIINIQGGPGGFLMENITLKNNLYESEGTKAGGVNIIVKLDDNIQIYNCLHTGWMPSEDQGAEGPLNIHVISPSGSATVKNYDFLFDGYSWKEYPGNTTGIYLGPAHVGSIVFDNCDLQYADGYYASHNDGNVVIKNSEFTNLNRSCIRLLGAGSEVHNCTFNVELGEQANVDGTIQFTHGVVWEGNDNYQKSGGKVVNCRFNFLSRADTGQTMRAIEAQNEQGALTVKDCEFNIQTIDTQILNCDQPTGSSSPHDITVENITATGSSTKNYHDHAIRIVGRDNSVIKNSCIDMSQDDPLSFTGDIKGILFENSNNCEVTDSTLNFNDQTIEEINSSVQTSGISENGNCSL